MATDLTKIRLEKRLEFVQDLWASIAAESSAATVSPEQLSTATMTLRNGRQAPNEVLPQSVGD